MDGSGLKKRALGSTGLFVSPLGLGTVKFGRNQGVRYPEDFEIPEEYFLSDLLSLARDLGINLLDTAPAYGESEERLGRLLKGQRESWIIAGKAGEEFENGQSLYNFTPAHIERSLERSLKRLQTEYLDIFLLHSDGRDLEILNDSALIEKMMSFKEQGLVRTLGASTKTVEGGLKALEILDVAMVTYNSGHTAEGSVIDRAMERGKGVLIKKALASGHFKISLQDSMDFVFGRPGVSSVIAGTINPLHLKENVCAVKNVLKKNLTRDS